MVAWNGIGFLPSSRGIFGSDCNLQLKINRWISAILVKHPRGIAAVLFRTNVEERLIFKQLDWINPDDYRRPGGSGF